MGGAWGRHLCSRSTVTPSHRHTITRGLLKAFVKSPRNGEKLEFRFTNQSLGRSSPPDSSASTGSSGRRGVPRRLGALGSAWETDSRGEPGHPAWPTPRAHRRPLWPAAPLPARAGEHTHRTASCLPGAAAAHAGPQASPRAGPRRQASSGGSLGRLLPAAHVAVLAQSRAPARDEEVILDVHRPH